jgi:hypothetical protein
VTDDLTDEMAILRATSDQLIQAIAETDARERRKRGMRPADPSFLEHARAVRIAAEAVVELAHQEERTAGEIVRESTTATLPPIEAMHPARELASILEEWRAIEQRMNTAEPGSSEAESLMMEFERLRDNYAQALKARRKDG